MSTYEFILPDIGEGVVEAEVVRWLVHEGEELAEDQPMVELMTDKATVQIPSPKQGRVLRLEVDEGKIALVGKPLIVLELSGAASAPAPSKGGNGQARGASTLSVGASAVAAAAASAPLESGRVLAAPATRRLARELGVDLRSVVGTGPSGRVTSDDVRAAGAPDAGARPATATSPLARPSDAAARPPVTSVADERIPLRGLRRKIAQKMQQSKNTAAHFTYVDEVDMTELVALRERSRRAAEERGVRLTYLPFLAKAVVAALRRFPMLNATLDDEKGEIVVRRSYHLGIAVATDDGLIVPVVRDADQKNLFELGREIDALGEKARTGKLAPGEASGSTFTITSLGKLGGLFATPIINHPEVAILGVHEIKKRPVVVEGQIVIRDIMLLSVSFDHRLIDGHVGAAFAQQVKSYLEDPHLLFLALA
jgi:pyruvate dehydrogenase E2 component (dihydrolipoamide acetyltransferase)